METTNGKKPRQFSALPIETTNGKSRPASLPWQNRSPSFAWPARQGSLAWLSCRVRVAQLSLVWVPMLMAQSTVGAPPRVAASRRRMSFGQSTWVENPMMLIRGTPAPSTM